ncbi:hypothetical protein J6590_049624 [Homalodisca vitripennis]|nr:hypothetical protein J6590_049624 [Homalodisca vitripennis]
MWRHVTTHYHMIAVLRETASVHYRFLITSNPRIDLQARKTDPNDIFPPFRIIGFGEVRAKKPSLTLNLGTNGLMVTSEPPPMAGQAGCLQGQGRSAVTHPSSSHARRCLIRLSCNNRCTHYTTPLALHS